MTPHLIEALGRLSGLDPDELALVSATATSLAAQNRSGPVRPPASPACRPMPFTVSRPVPIESRAASPDGGRLDLLVTTSWADGITVDDTLFASETYRRRLGPTVPTLFYIAGSAGLKRLADVIGRTVFKAGVTEVQAVQLRLSSLAAARYGACIKCDGAWVEEQGFDYFQAVTLPLQRRRGHGSPVQPALRAIAIDRPASLPLAVLDAAVRAGLDKASLARFADTDEAAALSQRRGLDAAMLQRYTPGPRGAASRVRHKRATELAIIGPRADADHIADLLERTVAGHVMGAGSTPSKGLS